MTTIQVQPERLVSGPISQDENNILNLLIENGETEAITIREKASLIRSRFWKAIFDLKDLGLIKLKNN